MNNFAFIDTQNVHQGIKRLGWRIDWARFRVYLKDKYNVEKAYLFIGFMEDQYELYEHLQSCGFILMFKPVTIRPDGTVKGNCDADLVLHAILKIDDYDKAIVATSDGDFYSLVRYLYDNGKLEMVLSSHVETCSDILKKKAKEKINYMFNLRNKVGVK